MAPLGSLYVLVKELLKLNCMNKCRCMFVWAYLCVCVCVCVLWGVGEGGVHWAAPYAGVRHVMHTEDELQAYLDPVLLPSCSYPAFMLVI